jgi:hypothetical protein
MTHGCHARHPAAILAVAIMVVGCAEPSIPISRPSPPAPPAAEPAPELRAVAIGGLTVGDAPPGADPLGAVPTALQPGEVVWVLDTVEVDGREHVLVVTDRDVPELETPFGWIPSAMGGEPTLVATDVTCPAPQLLAADVMRLGRFGGLGCFGNDPIQLIGIAPMGCGMGGSPREGEPEWLNGTWSGLSVGDAPPQAAAEVPFVTVRAAPGVGLAGDCGEPTRYRFTAHFDDPASESCRTIEETGAGVVTLDERLSAFLCRTHLVITEAQPLAGG